MPTPPQDIACHDGMPGTAKNAPTIAVNVITATIFGLVSSR
jgi:hypothetical protein